MRFLTLLTLAVVLVMNLLCANPAAASGSYQRRDLEAVKPVSELGWKVPLAIDLWILPPPTVGKILKYLTLGRGVITYECNSTNATQDTRPQFLRLNTELYDVAPLAQNLPNEDALHSLVPRLREYDYAELKNTSMNCVGRIYGHKGGVPFVHLFGFNVPEFNITLIWEIPPPTGPTTNGNWTRLATVDGTWEMYRVKTSGGAIPTSCKGHENSTIKVVYAAEYWFYHK